MKNPCLRNGPFSQLKFLVNYDLGNCCNCKGYMILQIGEIFVRKKSKLGFVIVNVIIN